MRLLRANCHQGPASTEAIPPSRGVFLQSEPARTTAWQSDEFALTSAMIEEACLRTEDHNPTDERAEGCARSRLAPLSAALVFLLLHPMATQADETAVAAARSLVHEIALIRIPKANTAIDTPPDLWPHTSPGGSFPANQFGLVDIVGNIWEWTSSCFDGEDTAHHGLPRHAPGR